MTIDRSLCFLVSENEQIHSSYSRLLNYEILMVSKSMMAKSAPKASREIYD